MRHESLIPSHRAAELLDITPHSLRTYRYEGRGPRFVRRSNGAVFYPIADLRDYLAGLAERAQRDADAAREKIARLADVSGQATP